MYTFAKKNNCMSFFILDKKNQNISMKPILGNNAEHLILGRIF